jgi:hypothetical protein
VRGGAGGRWDGRNWLVVGEGKAHVEDLDTVCDFGREGMCKRCAPLDSTG